MEIKKKLLYFVSEDWYFWSHRRHLALAAIAEGYDVYLLTNEGEYGDRIKNMNVTLISLGMDRHGKNILKEIKLLCRVIDCYKTVKPDITHRIALKPVLYGEIASILSGIRKSVNTFPGLGYVFQSSKFIDRAMAFSIMCCLRLLFKINTSSVIVQNTDDARFFKEKKLCQEKDIMLIKGSGIDLNTYTNDLVNSESSIVLFASRLLAQKGIIDFIKSAELTRKVLPHARFVIVGKPDKNNPNSIKVSELEGWQDNGIVEWWGYQDDMADILRQIKILVLPTYYGEGVPKILIEAAACGIPIVTTNVAGCREIVRQDLNGILVGVHSPEHISASIVKLLNDTELCKAMGQAGRKIVEEEFSMEKVNRETLHVYES